MAAKTRSGRVVKRPKRDDFTDLADVVKLCADEEKQRKTEEKKLWFVEELIDQNGDQVLVKWKDYGEEFNSWVSLTTNPELASYLEINVGNPDSSVVAKRDLPPLSQEETELWLVKHAVFDELQFRRTPENDAGLSRRVQVKVPFTKRAFSTLFEKGAFPLAEERKLDFSGTQNIKFSCTAAEIASVFGTEAFTRQFADSSTVCEADPCSKVYVSWGYELRVNYDHSSCPRCTYYSDAGEQDRPSTCSPTKVKIPPISYLELSFKKRRRNLLQQ